MNICIDTEAHTVVTSASAAAAASSATVNNSDTPPSSTSDNKSEISLVHEAALKRGQNVNFEVLFYVKLLNLKMRSIIYHS